MGFDFLCSAARTQLTCGSRPRHEAVSDSVTEQDHALEILLLGALAKKKLEIIDLDATNTESGCRFILAPRS